MEIKHQSPDDITILSSWGRGCSQNVAAIQSPDFGWRYMLATNLSVPSILLITSCSITDSAKISLNHVQLNEDRVPEMSPERKDADRNDNAHALATKLHTIVYSFD